MGNSAHFPPLAGCVQAIYNLCRPSSGTRFNLDRARETCQQITQGMDDYTEGFNAGIDLISSLQDVGREGIEPPTRGFSVLCSTD